MLWSLCIPFPKERFPFMEQLKECFFAEEIFNNIKDAPNSLDEHINEIEKVKNATSTKDFKEVNLTLDNVISILEFCESQSNINEEYELKNNKIIFNLIKNGLNNTIPTKSNIYI